MTCRELNKAKTALINGKILNVLGVIKLDKIKGKSICVNAYFEELKDKKSDNFSFGFSAKNLVDLLSFSKHLTDSKNNKITFNNTEKKNEHTNF